MTARSFTWALPLAFIGIGCSETNSQIGVDEPFHVRNDQAEFIQGSFPGDAIEDAGPDPEAPADDGPPSTTSPHSAQSAYFPGQTGASFTGDTSTNTASIGLKVDGVGTGYWVIPVSNPDPATGRPTWTASVDFGRTIPSGLQKLRVVAIDSRGRGGPQQVAGLCIKSLVPDNLQSCSPTREPPLAVISLSWDTNVDLDLQVIGPDGRVLEPKRASTIRVDGGTAETPPALFDRDSNASCAVDGFRVENLVWQTASPEGRYSIYANLFDACKQASVRFGISVFQAVDGADGGPKRLEQKRTAHGELLDIQANGGSARGLFVTDYVFR